MHECLLNLGPEVASVLKAVFKSRALELGVDPSAVADGAGLQFPPQRPAARARDCCGLDVPRDLSAVKVPRGRTREGAHGLDVV